MPTQGALPCSCCPGTRWPGICGFKGRPRVCRRLPGSRREGVLKELAHKCHMLTSMPVTGTSTSHSKRNLPTKVDACAAVNGSAAPHLHIRVVLLPVAAVWLQGASAKLAANVARERVHEPWCCPQDSTSFAGYEQTLKNEAEKAAAKVKGGAKKATQKVLLPVSPLASR